MWVEGWGCSQRVWGLVPGPPACLSALPVPGPFLLLLLRALPAPLALSLVCASLNLLWNGRQSDSFSLVFRGLWQERTERPSRSLRSTGRLASPFWSCRGTQPRGRGEAEGKRGQQLLLTAARLVLATREVEMVVKQRGGGWGTTGPA